MKKILVVLLTTMLLFTFVACDLLLPKTEMVKITLNYDNGTANKVFELEKGSIYTLPEAPKKDGYVFDCWVVDGKEYKANTSIKINSAVTIIAKYEELVKVTINYGDGTQNIETELKKGSNYTLPKAPSKEGFIFVGWFIGDTKCESTVKIKETVTITARYNEIVKLTINYGDGIDNKVIDVPKGENYTLPKAPEKEGYVFDGWYIGEVKCENIVKIDEDTFITAEYSIKKYQVTIVYNNETEDSIETVDWGTEYTIPESPTKEGYIFDGWFIDEKKVETATVSVFEDLKIVASYTDVNELYFEFTSVENNSCYEVSELKDKTVTDIVIPSEYKGKPVISIGSYAFRGCVNLKSVIIKEGIKTIEDNAFSQCKNLSSIEIPSSVTTIDNYAFFKCTSLISIDIPSGVISIGDNVFDSCSGLTNIEISSTVKSMGEDPFEECTSLTSINVNEENSYYSSIDGILFDINKNTLLRYPQGKTSSSYEIPNSVTSIGDSSFRDCLGLTEVTIPNSVTKICNAAFFGCENLISIEIPSSVSTIDNYAFSGCFKLSNVTISDGVTSIGDSAFSNCRALTNIVIPGSVTSIGSGAFNGAGLTDVTIEYGLTSIGRSVFRSCSNLSSIVIPNSVTTIGDLAFDGCSKLNNIEIPNSVTAIGDSAFKNCKMIDVTIPDSVTSIGNSAFYGCTSLKSIEIPSGITSIGISSFSNCTNVTSITIPEGVLVISESAFSWCESLLSIVIPSSVTTIGESSFNRCQRLENVTISEGVKAIGDFAFSDCEFLSKIEIPISVTSIGKEAFSSCQRLYNFKYAGTTTQWSSVVLGKDWSGNSFNVIHCSDGDVEL